MLLQQLAAELLKQYSKQVARAGYVRTAIGQLLQQPPVATTATATGGHSNVADVDFLLAALRYREARLTASAAMRLRRKSAQQSQFKAWNECCPQLLKLAEAHNDTVVMERFVARLADSDCMADTRTSNRLRRLCAL